MRHSRDSNARGLSKPVVYGTAGYRTNGLAESENAVSDFTDNYLILGAGGLAVAGVLWWTFSSSGSGKRKLPERA